MAGGLLLKKGKKKKAPKIQRLITPQLLQRKLYFKSQIRKHTQAGKQMKANYMERLAEYRQGQKEAIAAEDAKKKQVQVLIEPIAQIRMHMEAGKQMKADYMECMAESAKSRRRPVLLRMPRRSNKALIEPN
jgi:hypothetical protein